MIHPKSSTVFAIAVIAALLAPPASAGENAADYIQPRLDRTRFATFLAPLELDNDQQMIAELLFADYTAGLTELTDATNRAADAAGNRTVADALAGRRRIEPAALRELRAAVLTAYRGAWPTCDALLDTLINGLRGILIDEQKPLAAKAIVALRRDLWLEAWRDADAMPDYAGDGVDVIRLAAAARRGEGELSGVPTGELDRALDDYALRLDELLREVAPGIRAGALDQRIAQIRRDDAAVRRLESEAVERWRRFFELNRTAIDRIAAGLDEPRAERWRRRFDQASFPWLMRDDRPDRAYAWMQSNVSTPETLVRAAEVMRTYQGQRDALLGEAITLIVRGRLQLRRVIHPALSPVDFGDAAARELQEEMLRNSGARSTLSDSTEAALRELLSKDQRRQMSRALRAGR